MGGTLFFVASGSTGPTLWKSDGTAAGTMVVKSIPQGADIGFGYPTELIDVDGTLFFAVEYFYSPSGCCRVAVWKSDGTEAGTTTVTGFSATYPRPQLTEVGGVLFFTSPHALWRSDGTAAGTVLLRGGFPNTSAWPRTNVLDLIDVNSTLFFVANDGAGGMELWKSDGTQGGTALVKDIRPGPAGSSPHALTNVNGTLFFAADDVSSGVELRKSDGTEAGTVRVKDSNPGSIGSFPDHLANVYGTLFFAAYDTQNGYEPWRSDGSEAGTALVQDIEPGAASSTPSDITVAGNDLFFIATTSDAGRELWKLPITAVELRQPNLTLIPLTPFDPIASRTGVRVKNFSPIAATDVVLTLTLPAGLSFTAVDPTQGTCSVVGSTLTCQLGRLAGNSTATINTSITPTPAENVLLTARVAAHEADLDTADNTLATFISWPQLRLPYVAR